MFDKPSVMCHIIFMTDESVSNMLRRYSRQGGYIVLTLGDIPRRGARIFADKEALVFEGARFTYRQLDERVNRLAHALLGLGCEKGDRIAVYSENHHRYVELYFAAA